MYKAAGSQPGGAPPQGDGQGPAGGPNQDKKGKDGKDNVVDAEFVDVDPKDKK